MTSAPQLTRAFMSGYTDDSVVQRAVRDSSLALLHKPFTPEALTRKVREVLDARQAEPAIRS